MWSKIKEGEGRQGILQGRDGTQEARGELHFESNKNIQLAFWSTVRKESFECVQSIRLHEYL